MTPTLTQLHRWKPLVLQGTSRPSVHACPHSLTQPEPQLSPGHSSHTSCLWVVLDQTESLSYLETLDFPLHQSQPPTPQDDSPLFLFPCSVDTPASGCSPHPFNLKSIPGPFSAGPWSPSPQMPPPDPVSLSPHRRPLPTRETSQQPGPQSCA